MLVDYDYILRAFQFFEDAPILFVPLPDPHVTSPEFSWPAKELATRLASTKRRDGEPLGTVAPCAVYKWGDMATVFKDGPPGAEDLIRDLDVQSPWPPGAIIIYVVVGSCNVGVLAAVDYLLMSTSANQEYRRAYVLSAPPTQDEPGVLPDCAWVSYSIGTTPWTLSCGPLVVGEYKPYREPAETILVPEPPPAPPRPPAPACRPLPVSDRSRFEPPPSKAYGSRAARQAAVVRTILALNPFPNSWENRRGFESVGKG
jgi:hypothetical protein